MKTVAAVSLLLMLATSASALNAPDDRSLILDQGAYVDLTGKALQITGGPISVQVWFKTNQGQAYILETGKQNRGSGEGQAGYAIHIARGGKVRFGVNNGFERYRDDQWDDATTHRSYNDGEWHHVTGVFPADGKTRVSIFIDGALLPEDQLLRAGTAQPPLTRYVPTSPPSRIATPSGATPKSWATFRGQIDELRIWSVALTPDRIAQNYRQTVPADAPGLVARWPFNDGEHQLDDDTGAHRGTLRKGENPLEKKSFAGIEELFENVSVNDILQLKDGRLFMTFGPGAMGAYSTDDGKTWDEPFEMMDENGAPVSPSLGSLVESKPGVLGFHHTLEHPYVLAWRRSTDAGRTWSLPIPLNPIDGPVRNPHSDPRPFVDAAHKEMVYAGLDRTIVLTDGRIVIPFTQWLMGPISPEPGHPLGMDTEETLLYSFVMFSDDDGLTWQRSNQMIFIVLEGHYDTDREYYSYARGKGGFWEFEESTIVELADKQIMMFGRSVLARTFASFSNDRGLNWHAPVPMPIATTNAPSLLKRLSIGDILLIWNQCAREEDIKGFSRHRLSTALSTDEGETWTHHRNLESLDDVAYIEPPAVGTLHGVYGPHYHQPADRDRYHRAPGSVRSCYPAARVLPDCVVVSYNYGCKTDETPDMTVTTKTRVLPNEWFSSR